MRIIFIGAVEFSKRTLEKIISIGGNVVGVYTLKETTFNSDFCDLTGIARVNKIPIFYGSDINSDESIRWIKELNPDVIFCFGWSRLLNNSVLSIAPLGVVGFHPAALPINRGRHPIIWALVLGLKVTASTFFFMDSKADSGDILSQVSIGIDEFDDARTLYNKVITAALNQIEDFLPKLENDTYTVIKQDNTQANTWRKRGKADGIIDWRMSARAILNLVRGLGKPYVGAAFLNRGNEYKVWRAEFIENNLNNIEPGKVIGLEKCCPIVRCGLDAIKLTEIEPGFYCNIGDYL